MRIDCAELGLTDTLLTAPQGALVTVTAIEPDFAVLAVEVAMIVEVPTETAVIWHEVPLFAEATVATATVLDVQVTVCGAVLGVTVTVGVNTSPTAMVFVGGTTLTARPDRSAVTVKLTVAVLVWSEAKAMVMVAVPGETPVTSPVAETVATAVLEDDQLNT